MKNEKGSVLPLMIAITFVAAYLLVVLATQLEVRVASYGRTRTYMTMTLLEMEGLERLESFLQTAEITGSFSDTWTLRDNALMIINGHIRQEFFDFYYQIRYNGYVRSGNVSIPLIGARNFME